MTGGGGQGGFYFFPNVKKFQNSPKEKMFIQTQQLPTRRQPCFHLNAFPLRPPMKQASQRFSSNKSRPQDKWDSAQFSWHSVRAASRTWEQSSETDSQPYKTSSKRFNPVSHQRPLTPLSSPFHFIFSINMKQVKTHTHTVTKQAEQMGGRREWGIRNARAVWHGSSRVAVLLTLTTPHFPTEPSYVIQHHRFVPLLS